MADSSQEATSSIRFPDNEENDNEGNKPNTEEKVNEVDAIIVSECTSEIKNDGKVHEEQCSDDNTDKNPNELRSLGKIDIEENINQRNDDDEPYTGFRSNKGHRRLLNTNWKYGSGSRHTRTVASLRKSSFVTHTKVKDDETEENEIYKPSTSKTSVKKFDPKKLNEGARRFWDNNYIFTLQAGIIEAEIKGNLVLAEEHKMNLEIARKYKKKITRAFYEDNNVEYMRLATMSTENSTELAHNLGITSRNKSEKRKAETQVSSTTTKYFGNEEKYNSNQTLNQEQSEVNTNEAAGSDHAIDSSETPSSTIEEPSLERNLNIAFDPRDYEREEEENISEILRKSLDNCTLCIDNVNLANHLIINCGTKVYMALPQHRSLLEGHCLITTTQHSSCVTALEDDVWKEILYFRTMISQFFESINHDVVFYESATGIYKYPHLVINCIPLPKAIGHVASIYFKKAMLECETTWSQNEKILYLRRRNIRKAVPRRLPYFWVDFGMVPGFAHIIENDRLFPTNFGESVIGGMLRMKPSRWQTPKCETANEQKNKVLKFLHKWKPFEKSYQAKPHNT